MAQLNGNPFPPGDYPVVVVGSGPGGLQFSHSLRRMGVDHAVISADSGPGGMFRKFPAFQRLISWTKPHAPAEKSTREYLRYDWNSLITETPESENLAVDIMKGPTYFPSREEMEATMVAFVDRTGTLVRYNCPWTATRKTEDGFALETPDGEYTCRIAVFAIGVTAPWRPDTPGMDLMPHYAEIKDADEYVGKRVFIAGKRNSAFEIADGLLPLAKQIILASPRPTRISFLEYSTAYARARYMQPVEDHALGGGNLILDAVPELIERTSVGGYRVHLHGTTIPGDMVFEVDEAICATGWRTPLGDLPGLGVATFFGGDRLPAQTPYWESSTVPGIYFAGSVTQGAVGLKKHGIPSNSGAVHGFRFNAQVLAAHIAKSHFGIPVVSKRLKPSDLVPFLLREVTAGPELWNQPSYLARAVSIDAEEGAMDQGILPLSHFVDSDGPDAVAIALEIDASGDKHPAVYLRKGGKVDEYLLPSNIRSDFETDSHIDSLNSIIQEL